MEKESTARASAAALDPAARARLQAALSEIEESRKPFRAALDEAEQHLKPFRRSLDALQAAESALLDHHNVVRVGDCAACGVLLLEGDLGSRPYSDESQIAYCAECSPTWADVLGFMGDPSPLDTEDEVATRELAKSRPGDEKIPLTPLEAW